MINKPVMVMDTDDELAQITHAAQQAVQKYQEQAQNLTVTDEATEEAATIFIVGCKETHASLDDARDARVRPHNEYVREVNKAYKPFMEILEKLWKATDAMKSAYLVKKKREIEEANRRAIAKAEEERMQQARKEEAARLEAERLRLEAERLERERMERALEEEMARLANEKNTREALAAAEAAKRAGDEAAAREASRLAREAEAREAERAAKADAERRASLAEQKKLETAAEKQEEKADHAQARAMTVAPVIHTAQSLERGTRTLLDGSKATSRKKDTPVFENGCSMDEDYSRDDPRMQSIPDRYFYLDMAKLKRDAKAGVPVPGVTLIEGTATIARR